MNKVETFRTLVKKHDYSYMMSDDNYYYVKGQKTHKELIDMISEIGLETALAVWNEFYPKWNIFYGSEGYAKSKGFAV